MDRVSERELYERDPQCEQVAEGLGLWRVKPSYSSTTEIIITLLLVLVLLFSKVLKLSMCTP